MSLSLHNRASRTRPTLPATPNLDRLGHGFSEELYRDLLSAIWTQDGPLDDAQTCRWVAAVSELESLAPRDHVEAMIAIQLVSSHHAAMDCFRRAMNPNLSDDLAIRLRKTAATMMRAMTDAQRALDRLKTRDLPEPVENTPCTLTTDQTTDAAEPPPPSPSERAFSSLMPREPAPVDESVIRERIARARRAIIAEHGYDMVPDHLAEEADPFSADALAAQLRAIRAG